MKIVHLDQVRALVKTVRKHRGLTQSQTAALIGHTQKWLSEFESGKVDPPASMVIKLMALLGMPLQYTLPDVEREAQEHGSETEIGFDLNLEA